ncbi:hypothetical protein M8J77_024004 [Diaphorina citri]|nr:hypothetical protein M8J77_024004 [Diaphorina citri]
MLQQFHLHSQENLFRLQKSYKYSTGQLGAAPGFVQIKTTTVGCDGLDFRSLLWCSHTGRVLRVAAVCEDRCQMVCRPENNTSITPLGNNVFAITHPPTSFQMHCHQKEVEFLRLPAVVHGYLEMEVPCDCKAIVDEHHHIDSIFPCDDRWSQNLTTHHIIPSTWISLPKEDIGKVLQNDSLQYEAKLNALLSEGWETKPKSVFVVPESVSEDVSLYSKFRESAGEYHVEWTTVVTVLVIIILFRQPINILLVRLVSCGGRDDPPDGFHRP